MWLLELQFKDAAFGTLAITNHVGYRVLPEGHSGSLLEASTAREREEILL